MRRHLPRNASRVSIIRTRRIKRRRRGNGRLNSSKNTRRRNRCTFSLKGLHNTRFIHNGRTLKSLRPTKNTGDRRQNRNRSTRTARLSKRRGSSLTRRQPMFTNIRRQGTTNKRNQSNNRRHSQRINRSSIQYKSQRRRRANSSSSRYTRVRRKRATQIPRRAINSTSTTGTLNNFVTFISTRCVNQVPP